MKKAFFAFLLSLGFQVAWGECNSRLAFQPSDETDEEKQDAVNLRVEGRGEYELAVGDGKKIDEDSGIRGKYLNVILSGEFAGKFSYMYRQRMNKFSKDMYFFDATDFLYLNYKPVPQVTLSAGKQAVEVGGYEYERAPIDIYYYSEFCNNVSCYAWGASVAYEFGKKNDKLLAQVCQSPYDNHQNDLYAYNLMWIGNHGIWKTRWSLNAVGISRGRHIGYLALGNEFQFSPHWRLQLDFINRASRHQNLFDCYNITGELCYSPSKHVNIFAKGSYDTNDSHTDADQMVVQGTHITLLGAGGEYLPLKGRLHDLVRLHAYYCYSFGRNTNPNGIIGDNQHHLNVGLTCRVDVFKLIKNKKL